MSNYSSRGSRCVGQTGRHGDPSGQAVHHVRLHDGDDARSGANDLCWNHDDHERMDNMRINKVSASMYLAIVHELVLQSTQVG